MRQEGYVYTLMDKSQISNNSNLDQRNAKINSRQIKTSKLFVLENKK